MSSPIEPESKSLESLWYVIGGVGQALFAGRMVVQWIVSERAGKSVMPIAFWYMSLVGGFMTLAYAIYRKDPIFIAGQALGSIVYVRNLVMINSKRRTVSESDDAPSTEASSNGGSNGGLAGDSNGLTVLAKDASGCTCPCTCGARAKRGD